MNFPPTTAPGRKECLSLLVYLSLRPDTLSPLTLPSPSPPCHLGGLGLSHPQDHARRGHFFPMYLARSPQANSYSGTLFPGPGPLQCSPDLMLPSAPHETVDSLGTGLTHLCCQGYLGPAVSSRWMEDGPNPSAPAPMSARWPAPQPAAPSYLGPHTILPLPQEVPPRKVWGSRNLRGPKNGLGEGQPLAAQPGDGRQWSRGQQRPGPGSWPGGEWPLGAPRASRAT